MIAKLSLGFSLMIVSLMTAITFTTPALAACGDAVLGFPPWYQHLTNDKCEIMPITENGGNGSVKLQPFIWTVALNIVQILLVAVAYVTVFFIIKGGFMYITSQGDPSNMASAKQDVKNAIIGLVIALLAASIVNAIAGALP